MIFRNLNLSKNFLEHRRSIKQIELNKKMTFDECIYFFQESTNIKEIFIDSTNNLLNFILHIILLKQMKFLVENLMKMKFLVEQLH